ncbi:MAG: rhodanese-like domain-containing protein [Planctomycetales bacterium]|nr:rhodanese-like domain-containing protein [Planctomycetales bacterium]
MSLESISVKDLHSKISRGEQPAVIDVRTPAEFQECHASMARNVPLDSLDPRQVIANLNGAADGKIYIICRSGSRSKMACDKFQAAGISQVVNVAGGTQAWDAEGFPVARGKKVMSLERQVRITAGFMVLAATVLGFQVNPYFHVLSGIVGAGFIHSGLTDTCAMGMLIAKMPWNQVKSSCRSA